MTYLLLIEVVFYCVHILFFSIAMREEMTSLVITLYTAEREYLCTINADYHAPISAMKKKIGDTLHLDPQNIVLTDFARVFGNEHLSLAEYGVQLTNGLYILYKHERRPRASL
jgi:hypothetical protein